MPSIKITANQNGAVQNNAEGSVKSGTIAPYGGGAVPDGWLLCDGRAFLRSQYPTLFAAIGTAHGNGTFTYLSGVGVASGFTINTAFNIPDGRGKFLRGVAGVTASANPAISDPDAGGRVAAAAGGNAGNSVGSYQNSAQQLVTGQAGRANEFAYRGGDSGGAFGNERIGGYNGIRSGGGDASWLVKFDNSRVARTSSEDRPRNIYINWIIKI